jgi:chorismate-pyruvate lyase
VLLQSEAAGEATRVGETGHGARLGELLIEDALVTRDQLDEALRVQRTLRGYVPLGQILMMQGALTRTQLMASLKRHRKRARLGELLVRAGHVTPAQLETALASQQQSRKPLGHTLVSLGYVTEETMRQALCTQLHVNFFDLDSVRLDPALGSLVNERYAVRRRFVPVFQVGTLLVIAVDDPTDLILVEELQRLLRLQVEVVTSTTAKILRAITRLYSGERSASIDPVHANVIVGPVHDREIADLAARALNVRVLPPYWQLG